jgi:hypothetical protein
MLTSDLVLDHSYVDSYNVNHFYFTRVVNRRPVAKQNAAVHISEGQVVYVFAANSKFSASFSLTSSFQRRAPIISNLILCESEAIRIAETLLDIPKDNETSVLGYLETPGGIVDAYTFQLRDDANSRWFQVSINAQSGMFRIT